MAGREQSLGMTLWAEPPHLLPLASEEFDPEEASFPKVDGSGCMRVRTNPHSIPLAADTRAPAKVYANRVEIWHGGAVVARHERGYEQQKQILNLEHYWVVLEQKPGTLAGSPPLAPVSCAESN
jgi:hypothetical protein